MSVNEPKGLMAKVYADTAWRNTAYLYILKLAAAVFYGDNGGNPA